MLDSSLNKIQLPTQEYFYNKLNGDAITDSQSDHTQLILKTFGAYNDLYMKTDVLLYVPIFKTSRMFSQNLCFGAAQFFTLSGYTFSCMIKNIKCKLKTVQDLDLFLFIKRGIR